MVYVLILGMILISIILFAGCLIFLINNKPILAGLCGLVIFGLIAIIGVVIDKAENIAREYIVDSCVLYTSNEDKLYKFILIGENGRRIRLYIPEDKIDKYYNGKEFKISESEIKSLT